MNQALKELGYPTVSLKVIESAIGNDKTKFMQVVMPNEDKQTLNSIWEYYEPIVKEKGTEKTTVFDGVENVLNVLKERGYTLVVYTNKTQKELDPFIERFLSKLPFDRCVAIGGTTFAKPNPEMVLKILKEFGAERENAYFIGDGETDVMTARNAGIECVAVLWGCRTKEQLKEVGANIFAQMPKQLLDLIK
jgi:phosphoglycolate phosphatase